jgi:transposase
VIEVNLEEWETLLERARKEPLDEKGYEKLQAALRAFRLLTEMIGEKNTTISRLRALLAKPSTEKTSKVLEQAGIKAPPKNSPPPNAPGPPKPGHGRNGAQAYGGARRIKIAHASLKRGDHCPECQKGKVYEQKEPALRIRVVGQAPIAATVYELERLRCNLCGEIFEAAAPASVGEKKYDETAAAMIALLKYGSGVPFYRLEGLEASLGIPLPASTQWEIVEEIAAPIRPAFDELLRQAAQGEVFYNDDTSMKILALARASPSRPDPSSFLL